MSNQYPAVTRREMVALAVGTSLAGCSGLLPAGQEGTAQPVNRQGTATSTDGAQQERTGETVRAFVGSYHWGYFLLDADGTERDRLTLSPGDELRLTLFNVEADSAIERLPQAVRAGIPGAEDRARRNEQTIPIPRGTSLDALHEAAEAAYPDHSLALVGDAFLRPSGRGQGEPPQGPGGGPYGPGDGPWGGHHGPHGPGGGQGPGGGYGPGGGQGPGGGYGPGGGQGPGGGYGPGGGQGPMGPGGCWGPAFGGTLAPTTYLWHHSTVPAELGFVVDTTGSFGFACTVYCGYGHPYMAEPGRVVVGEE
ncbi:hypothetical protein [Haloarcula pellucida]|nr:hypothetical protein [Halomicroarcula pellucida]MBX0349425.1 hypothetical protein [Halomicroarcula pellucida]